MIEFILIALGIVALVAISVGAMAWKGWLPNIVTHEGRRAWALLALLGGCVVFTLFAAAGVYILRGDTQLTFYLALAAHAQILVGMLTLGGLLIRRSVKVTKSGVEYTDHEVRTEQTKKIEK